MNFLARLRAMTQIGDSINGLIIRSRKQVIVNDTEALIARVGDIEGQTARAQAFAAELDRKLIGK